MSQFGIKKVMEIAISDGNPSDKTVYVAPETMCDIKTVPEFSKALYRPEEDAWMFMGYKWKETA